MRIVLFILTGLCLAAPGRAAERPDPLPLPATAARPVTAEEMARIHEEVKTPFKYGVVIPAAANEAVDGPKIFRRDGHWYMIFVSFRDKIGYETHLARSPDLLHWERLGVILPFRQEGWDAWQGNGAPALIDPQWDGTHGIGSHEGRYWMSYVGGHKRGYETDPLSIGLASTDDPVAVRPWERFAGNPILAGTPAQRDARPFESLTLYTSTILRVDPALLGYPFVIFYNGKTPPNGHEAIGMAVSHDLREWRRLGDSPLVDNQGESRWALSGNPQIVKLGGLWVMFYFGAFWKPNAFDTFAASPDLVHWTKWEGPHLVEPSEPWDRQFAHKPWVLKHDGVVYHFYCAVGDRGRVIALATSRDLRSTPRSAP
jgi:predicted GH43/DUF377 family glycosyl hydrolase